MIRILLWPLLMSVTLLSGCSLIQLSNQETLSKLDHWNIQGKISIRSPQDAVTGYLNWKQEGSGYDIFITGPLGQGSTSIKGKPGRTELQLPGWKQPQIAEAPEVLMQHYLGWNFPIQDIFHWIKGQPAPGADFTIKKNDYGMTESLQQHGWGVEYSRYQQQNDHWLPGRIKITGHDHRFILSINQWTVYD